MCIFVGPVKEVCRTRIFLAPTTTGRQLTVYQCGVDLPWHSNRSVMVLAVPNPGEQVDQIHLINTSGVHDFFDRLANLVWEHSKNKSLGSLQSAKATLPVHKMGLYDVSVVANSVDLPRLHRSLQIPEVLQQELERAYPHGDGWSFLAATITRSGKLHPLAYTHPGFGSADSARLFAPTRHFHDHGMAAEVLSECDWDHMIYAFNGQSPFAQRSLVWHVDWHAQIADLLRRLDCPTEFFLPGRAVLNLIKLNAEENADTPNTDLLFPILNLEENITMSGLSAVTTPASASGLSALFWRPVPTT